MIEQRDQWIQAPGSMPMLVSIPYRDGEPLAGYAPDILFLTPAEGEAEAEKWADWTLGVAADPAALAVAAKEWAQLQKDRQAAGVALAKLGLTPAQVSALFGVPLASDVPLPGIDID